MILELTAQLNQDIRDTQVENANRKKIVETRDNQLAQAAVDKKAAQDKFQEMMKEQAAAKDEIQSDKNLDNFIASFVHSWAQNLLTLFTGWY